ncbi:hypothetical protein C1H46_007122 [Malus baccata]|uniref:Auxin-responsive protein n=1 Tax=Malus baccata TaxID=106549 RepID=A0A540N9Y6_MALBA|nr:hypothetical protein C1H46_007122 [Malus baccata]
MAKSRTTSTCTKNKSIVKLKIVVEKLQRTLSLGRSKSSNYSDGDSTTVPEDVKEGHFAVIAVEGDEPKRFVVALSYLTHSTFLKLLEEAAEEYGFVHEDQPMHPCTSAMSDSFANLWTKIWRARVPPKVTFGMWRVCNDINPRQSGLGDEIYWVSRNVYSVRCSRPVFYPPDGGLSLCSLCLGFVAARPSTMELRWDVD